MQSFRYSAGEPTHAVDPEHPDRTYLAKILFNRYGRSKPIEEEMGEHRLPEALNEHDEQFKKFDRNALPDIIAKQLIYFVRYANGQPGMQLPDKPNRT